MSIADPYLWPEDFLDAHERHWEDAEFLFNAGRLPNADHLYGLSAECGLKAILEARMPEIVRPRGRLLPEYRRHVNQLWIIFRDLMNSSRNALNTGEVNFPRDECPFEDWRIDQRYAARHHFLPEFVQPHREGAAAVRNLIQVLNQGGV